MLSVEPYLSNALGVVGRKKKHLQANLLLRRWSTAAPWPRGLPPCPPPWCSWTRRCSTSHRRPSPSNSREKNIAFSTHVYFTHSSRFKVLNKELRLNWKRCLGLVVFSLHISDLLYNFTHRWRGQEYFSICQKSPKISDLQFPFVSLFQLFSNILQRKGKSKNLGYYASSSNVQRDSKLKIQ